jgi:hypothetical protein
MVIDYDGRQYDFDLEEVTLAQLTRAFKAYGMTLMELEVGMQLGNPNALRAAYWMMLAQNGENVGLDRLSFKPVKLAKSINAAFKAEKAKDEGEEGDEEGPKDTDSQA